MEEIKVEIMDNPNDVKILINDVEITKIVSSYQVKNNSGEREVTLILHPDELNFTKN